jgi:hypothetical protein
MGRYRAPQQPLPRSAYVFSHPQAGILANHYHYLYPVKFEFLKGEVRHHQGRGSGSPFLARLLLTQ